MIYDEIYIVKEDGFDTYKLKIKGEGISYFLGKGNADYAVFTIKVNGVSLNFSNFKISEDYVITFNSPLEFGDMITINDSVHYNTKIISKNKYDKKALFKQSRESETLKSNHKYTVNLNVRDDDFSYSFDTDFNPLYTTVEKIRTGTGTILDSTDDYTILKAIYNTSKNCLERIEAEDVDVDFSNGTPTIVRDYVMYTVQYEFVYAVYLSLCAKSGTNSKSVGDISIREGVRGIPKEMLTSAKKLAENAEMNLFNTSKVANFVKAGSTTYPVDGRGVF